jgi:hypothetical protein
LERIDPEAVRTARRSILNSCKRALNYDESDLKKFLESGEFTKPAPVAEQQKVAPEPRQKQQNNPRSGRKMTSRSKFDVDLTRIVKRTEERSAYLVR